MADAIEAAQKMTKLPRQALEATNRLLNLHMEKAVLATLDFANTAEEQSFRTEDFKAIVDGLNAAKNWSTAASVRKMPKIGYGRAVRLLS